jgi:predicted  nucleic acid-binding Zn-ribbon protein
MFLGKYEYPKDGRKNKELKETMGNIDAKLETQELTGQVGYYVGVDSKKDAETSYVERKLYADGFGTEETNNISEKIVRPFVDKITSKENKLFKDINEKRELLKKLNEELLNIKEDIEITELNLEDLKKRIHSIEGEQEAGEMKYRLEIKKQNKERTEKEIREIKNKIENIITNLEKIEIKINN